MKSFGQKSWMLPQPVLIIGTYNNDGTPNAMNAAWGGQWDAKEIMIAMGAHATTENLNNCPYPCVVFEKIIALKQCAYNVICNKSVTVRHENSLVF